jgi:outer membrane receptor protein involved in Fe transport
MTFAGGWKAWFLTLDANWTTGDVVSKDRGQVGDKPIQSFTLAPRFGTLISSGRLGTGALWVGGMYLRASSEIRGKVDLSQHPLLANLVGRDSLNYSVRVEPKDNWNVLIGGNWEFNKHWSLTAEVGGILDRFHAIGAVMWRF